MPVSDKSIKFNEHQFNTVPFNAWSYPVAPANINSVIRNTVHYPFRKVEIKRRSATTGLYESSWIDITQYVEKYGTAKTSIDDVRVNFFVHSGINLTVRNDYGEFNPEWEGESLFHGSLTRVKTLVRITAGYTDGSGNQYPTDATQGIYVMTGDINTVNKNNVTTINAKALTSLFEEVRASLILGISESITASEIIERIRDATDGAGGVFFRDAITSTLWDIQSTTNVITTLGTTTALEDFTVWELMNKLAETEGYTIHITKQGGVVFGDREPTSDSPSIALYGNGFRDPNIIEITSYKPAIDKLYTNVRYQFLPEDTETSYINLGNNFAVKVTSQNWIYGQRTYEYDNTFFTNTDTAYNSAVAVINEFANLKSEMEVNCLFLPHVEILDRVSVSNTDKHRTSIYNWDERDWAADTTTSDPINVLLWASETTAALEMLGEEFTVISKQTNLDNFVTTLKLRKISGG